MELGKMGGHAWAMDGHVMNPVVKKWGYGGAPKSEVDWKECYSRTALQLAQLREQGLAAGVYTQTRDDENEVNGLLTYDRVPKVSAAWLKWINDGVVLGRKASSPRTGLRR